MTILKEINGFVVTPNKIGIASIVVRFTSDSIGESISLECGGLMFQVPFEQVKEIIEEARAQK